jgi:hypothetical protein
MFELLFAAAAQMPDLNQYCSTAIKRRAAIVSYLSAPVPAASPATGGNTSDEEADRPKQQGHYQDVPENVHGEAQPAK